MFMKTEPLEPHGRKATNLTLIPIAEPATIILMATLGKNGQHQELKASDLDGLLYAPLGQGW